MAHRLKLGPKEGPVPVTFTTEQIMQAGTGSVFRGSPNTGVIAGPSHSPYLPLALHEGPAPGAAPDGGDDDVEP